MYLIYIIILYVFCAVISGEIAESKGRSYFGWIILGLVFGPFALAVSLLPSIKARKYI